MDYGCILTGIDARDWMRENNIQSPDLTNKTAIRVNRFTVVYLDKSLNITTFDEYKRLTSKSSRRSNGDTDAGTEFLEI